MSSIFAPHSPFIQRLSILPASFGLAFIATNALILAIESVPGKTGRASALITSMEMAFGALGSYIVVLIGSKSMLPISVLMFIAGLISYATYWFLCKNQGDQKNLLPNA